MPSVRLPGLTTAKPAGAWVGNGAGTGDPPPIRVCFLIDFLGTGGTEWQLLALIRHLDRTQVQPFLALLDGETAKSRALEPADCPVLRLGVRSLCRPGTGRAAIRFARFLRRERIDVLQVYFADSSYFGIPVARLAGVPRVVRTRLEPRLLDDAAASLAWPTL